MPPQTFTVVVDTREKKPRITANSFPGYLPVLLNGRETTVRIEVESGKLDTGDYALRGYESCGLIETKGSALELAQNCLTDDAGRFDRCLRRLREEAAHPLVAVEGSFGVLLGDRRGKKNNFALDALEKTCLRHDVPLRLYPATTTNQRRMMAESLLRFLIQASTLPQEPTP